MAKIIVMGNQTFMTEVFKAVRCNLIVEDWINIKLFPFINKIPAFKHPYIYRKI